MKVILTEEVHGLGEPGKVLDVAPGYARNFLVPRKLAVYANEGNVRELEHHKRRLERKRQQLFAAAKTVTQRIDAQVVTFDMRAGESGRLFGSVTTSDIADALKAQYGVEVDRRKIHLHEPIRTLGVHDVDIHLAGEARATVKVNVVDTTHVEPPAPAPQPEQPAEAPAVEDTEE